MAALLDAFIYFDTRFTTLESVDLPVIDLPVTIYSVHFSCIHSPHLEVNKEHKQKHHLLPDSS